MLFHGGEAVVKAGTSRLISLDSFFMRLENAVVVYVRSLIFKDGAFISRKRPLIGFLRSWRLSEVGIFLVNRGGRRKVPFKAEPQGATHLLQAYAENTQDLHTFSSS